LLCGSNTGLIAVVLYHREIELSDAKNGGTFAAKITDSVRPVALVLRSLHPGILLWEIKAAFVCMIKVLGFPIQKRCALVFSICWKNQT